MAGPRVDDIYEQVKAMAVSFRLRPGDRLNEVALSKELGVSRTPLREALNRLVAERLFDFRPGQGFFCRPLDAQSVFDLFELKAAVPTTSQGRGVTVLPRMAVSCHPFFLQPATGRSPGVVSIV